MFHNDQVGQADSGSGVINKIDLRIETQGEGGAAYTSHMCIMVTFVIMVKRFCRTKMPNVKTQIVTLIVNCLFCNNFVITISDCREER